MIASLLVALALASQTGAFKYSQEYAGANAGAKYEYPAAKFQRFITTTEQKLPHSQSVRFVAPSVSVASMPRNLVARGKYPVTLQSCGPTPDRKIPVVTSHLRAPLQEKPTVRLQTKIPAPKTVAHTCTCFKTIIKPRVHQHIITVPTIQRYIETTHRPVVENIHYEGYPVGCLESSAEVGKEKSQVETFQVKDVSAIARLQMAEGKKGSEGLELTGGQAFALPQGEKVQVIQIPRVQFSQGQQSQGMEVPRVQFVESSGAEAFGVQEKEQVVEVPRAQFLEGKGEGVEVPRVEFVQKVQAVEIPRVRVAESPEVQTIALGSSPYTFRFNN